jgi:hypothetical protein
MSPIDTASDFRISHIHVVTMDEADRRNRFKV